MAEFFVRPREPRRTPQASCAAPPSQNRHRPRIGVQPAPRTNGTQNPQLQYGDQGLRATAIHLVQQLSRQTDWTFRFTMLGPLQIAFVNIEETGLEQG